MHPPTPPMAGDAGRILDDSSYQPFNGPLHILALQVELPDHVQQIVGHGSHFQPDLVGLETMTASLVPAQGVLRLIGIPH